MGSYSHILFAHPNFLSGAASVLDIGDTMLEFNSCESGEQADLLAVQSDWNQVGADFMKAFETVKERNLACHADPRKAVRAELGRKVR